MHTFGLIPAAGQSRRMGRPKLLLPLGERTVVEHVIAAVLLGGVERVLVVVPPGADRLAELAESAGAAVLRLEADTPDMRGTCAAGLDWMQEHWRPDAKDGWLLLPADHPTTRSNLVAAILTAASPAREQSIVVPVHRGKRGHPVWLRWEHVEAIRNFPADLGLNAFIRTQAERTLELEWEGEEVLADLDTPADYERLQPPGAQ